MATKLETEPPVVLITGAARRLGAALVDAFHRQGYRVAIHYCHSHHEAAELCQHLNRVRPGSAALFQADLCNLPEIERLAASVLDHFGRLDTLINNASRYFPTSLDNLNENDWNSLMASNLSGPFFLCRALAQELVRRQGTIVNMADINGRQPRTGYSIYSIAKAGIIMLTRALARELAPAVNVNGIAPGCILWPEGAADFSETQQKKVIARIPLGRVGSARDIANVALFLATTPGYLTGQVIAVDGGLGLTTGYD